MTTANDIIKSALRKIQALGKGEALDDNDADEALSALNAMLASWSVEGGYIYVETKETFNLSTAASYTIGSGGDFNTARPLKITSMYTSTGGTDNPVLQISNTDYSYITQKGDASTYPDYFYYDANYPTGTIYFYPKPVGGTVTINSYKHLTSFSALDTVYAMPPEYQAALEYNLAVWIAPEYEREALPSVQRIAHQTKQALLIQNSQNKEYISYSNAPMGSDSKGYGNIYEGFD